MTTTTPTRLAVIGLGSMGGAMAATLRRAGWDTVGFDLSEAARSAAAEAGVTPLEDLADAAGTPYVVLSLPSAAIVRQAVPTLLSKPGTIAIIDMTTSDPATSREMATLANEHGVAFIDAPVSGGTTGAASGTLAAFVGGSDADVAASGRVLDDLTGGTWQHIGPAGAGNVVKLLNNMLASVNLLAVAEAMDVAAAWDIDLDRAIVALNTATGESRVSRKMFPDWVLPKNYTSGFALGLMARDVALALDVAKQGGADPQLFQLTDEAWQQALEALGPSADFVAATSTFTSATNALATTAQEASTPAA